MYILAEVHLYLMTWYCILQWNKENYPGRKWERKGPKMFLMGSVWDSFGRASFLVPEVRSSYPVIGKIL